MSHIGPTERSLFCEWFMENQTDMVHSRFSIFGPFLSYTIIEISVVCIVEKAILMGGKRNASRSWQQNFQIQDFGERGKKLTTLCDTCQTDLHKQKF